MLRIFVRLRASAPTLREMDILLSLSTTIKLLLPEPALLSASYAIPPVIAPSPIIATAVPFSPFSFLAR